MLMEQEAMMPSLDQVNSEQPHQQQSAQVHPRPGEPLVFIMQHQNDRFDSMPFSIARSWREEMDADLVLYVMYDAVELLKKDTLAHNAMIKEDIDALLESGVTIYACGFCSRACSLDTDSYHPGVQVANRTIFHDLLSQRRALYW